MDSLLPSSGLFDTLPVYDILKTANFQTRKNHRHPFQETCGFTVKRCIRKWGLFFLILRLYALILENDSSIIDHILNQVFGHYTHYLIVHLY